MKRIFFFSLFFMLALCAVVSAQPSISLVSGNIVHDSTITITGGGFGTKNPAPPYVWDDFEGGSSGSEIRGSSPTLGPDWDDFTHNPHPIYSDANTYAGNLAALIRWQEYAISSIIQNWELDRGVQQEIFLSYHRYLAPQEPGTLPINHKQLYVFSDGPNEAQQLMIGAIMTTKDRWAVWWQNNPTSGFDYNSNTNTWSETINQWQKWDVYAKLDMPYTDSNGEVKTWLEGELAVDEIGVNIRNDNGLWKRMNIGHMYQGYHPGGTDRTYLDDIYIDFTQARIELCDNPSWSDKNANGGHCEIQIPQTWSDGSITFTANQGTFADGQAYLYVVDENGDVNEEGFEVTVGGDPEEQGQCELISAYWSY